MLTMGHLTDEQLNEYLDGRLSLAGMAEATQHLANCAACQAHLAALQTLFTTLDALPDLPLATDLSGAVLAGLPRRAPAWLRPLLLGQLLLALLLLLWLWPNTQSQLATWTATGQQGWRALMASFPAGGPWAQMAAGWQTVQTSLANFWTQTRPVLALPAGQWLLLTGLALVVWLLGNSLLLAQHRRVHDA